ncbi:Fic family protein [Halomarina rubra]|uniref:Fic family protein n=1 Tax=Halomarina rubra TaxID=2071873 RepID=A0ABD6AW37_9EURY|nr:Fic family protein [Halomarina rubra]
MRKGSLPETAPGHYVPYHPNPYYAPNELPVKPPLAIPDDIRDLVADAAYQIGRVDGISSTVDFSASLYASLIRVEAVESARIEGAEVDYQDVEAYRTQHSQDGATPPAKKDLQEAINYEDALMAGLNAVTEGEPITLELMTELHATLLEGVRNDGDIIGAFRDHMVHLDSPRGGQRPFVPPTPDSIERLMKSLEAYIQSGGAYHPLIDAAIIHYFFETVHPFSDGNGRLGRLLIILYLVQQGYLESPYIYPSAYFNKNKYEYVSRMRAVSEEGAWTEWFRFFIEGLRSQAEASYDRTWDLRELEREYHKEYTGTTATARFARSILQKPYFTPTGLAAFLDVSRPTAYRVIEDLEADEIIEEVTGKKQGKQYRAVDVFDILQ